MVRNLYEYTQSQNQFQQIWKHLKQNRGTENHTPEPIASLSPVNTFVSGNFKTINRISEVLSESLLFFTDIALTANEIIFSAKKILVCFAFRQQIR